MANASPVTIACDESGSEGENLMAAQEPVFVHGSANVSLERATELMNELQASTRSQSTEVKSTTVLKSQHRPALLRLLESLEGAANINLVEKPYFVTAKLIDLLVHEQARSRGADLAASGEARVLATELYDRAPVALGGELWWTLLSDYNKLIRSYLRAGSQPPSAVTFFKTLLKARRACSDPVVAGILDSIWDARWHALEYQGSSPSILREMDPMAPTLTAVAVTWRIRLGDVPFEFLADNYGGLTEEVRRKIVEASREPLSVGDFEYPRADLRGIRLIDSRLDARVQLADIVAGVGRVIARTTLSETRDDELFDAAYEMLDFNPLCSPGSPIDALTNGRRLRYLDAWPAPPRSAGSP